MVLKPQAQATGAVEQQDRKLVPERSRFQSSIIKAFMSGDKNVRYPIALDFGRCGTDRASRATVQYNFRRLRLVPSRNKNVSYGDCSGYAPRYSTT